MEDKRTTWTMRGWRETLKDGTQVMRAEAIAPTDLQREKGEKQKVIKCSIFLLNLLYKAEKKFVRLYLKISLKAEPIRFFLLRNVITR